MLSRKFGVSPCYLYTRYTYLYYSVFMYMYSYRQTAYSIHKILCVSIHPSDRPTYDMHTMHIHIHTQTSAHTHTHIAVHRPVFGFRGRTGRIGNHGWATSFYVVSLRMAIGQDHPTSVHSNPPGSASHLQTRDPMNSMGLAAIGGLWHRVTS